jgi:hypothetical protein
MNLCELTRIYVLLYEIRWTKINLRRIWINMNLCELIWINSKYLIPRMSLCELMWIKMLLYDKRWTNIDLLRIWMNMNKGWCASSRSWQVQSTRYPVLASTCTRYYQVSRIRIRFESLAWRCEPICNSETDSGFQYSVLVVWICVNQYESRSFHMDLCEFKRIKMVLFESIWICMNLYEFQLFFFFF